MAVRVPHCAARGTGLGRRVGAQGQTRLKGKSNFLGPKPTHRTASRPQGAHFTVKEVVPSGDG